MSMFHGREWFAWYPLSLTTTGYRRLAWLETVWRDECHNRDGTTTVRHYTR